MNKLLCCLLLAALAAAPLRAEDHSGAALPVRAFCIGAPHPAELERFLAFVDEALVPRHINTLVLRVDYNFQYQTHPELAEKNGLSLADVKQIVANCQSNHIHLIPQINLLGHQSWHSSSGKLLAHYPEFDETPWVKYPVDYKWPNADGLYCRSYCPLHPKVHEIVFALVDELCDAFESDTFHAGMDEVFYLGDSQCPRCRGRDKAQLFAGEVSLIRDHVREKNRALWIWGDRLLDGYATGLGEWEASYNGTARAIDMIPHDVVICDWHYDVAAVTPAYFALKGFDVIICPWRLPKVGAQEAADMLSWRARGPAETRRHLLGLMQTTWTSMGDFLEKEYHGDSSQTNSWTCLTASFAEMDKAAP